jgi:hypothetical protein
LLVDVVKVISEREKEGAMGNRTNSQRDEQSEGNGREREATNQWTKNEREIVGLVRFFVAACSSASMLTVRLFTLGRVYVLLGSVCSCACELGGARYVNTSTNPQTTVLCEATSDLVETTHDYIACCVRFYNLDLAATICKFVTRLFPRFMETLANDAGGEEGGSGSSGGSGGSGQLFATNAAVVLHVLARAREMIEKKALAPSATLRAVEATCAAIWQKSLAGGATVV